MILRVQLANSKCAKMFKMSELSCKWVEMLYLNVPKAQFWDVVRFYFIYLFILTSTSPSPACGLFKSKSSWRGAARPQKVVWPL